MATLTIIIMVAIQTFITHVLGATISLSTSPSEFQANLTKTLTLRCSVDDTPPSGSGSVIGRRDVLAGDIQFLISLVVMRNGTGEHVASVTEHTPAVGRVDPDNLRVSGDLVQAAAQKGYLELTWTFPQGVDASDYVCEANGINADGHSVVLTKSVVIDLSSPNCADLVPFIHDHELRLLDHNLKIITDTSDIAVLKTNAAKQEAQIANMKQTHQSDMAHLQNQINQIMTSLNTQNHIESGTISCGNSDTWHNGDYLYTSKAGYFSKSFEQAPIVFLSVNGLDYDSDVSYKAYVTNVYTNRFIMRCETYHSEKVRRMTVNWISLSH